MKRCKKCEEEKDLTNFSIDKKSRDGRTSLCKVCAAEKTRAWVVANKEKKLAADAVYRATHIVQVKAYKKAYYEVNKVEVLAKHMAYHELNRDKRLKRFAEYRAENPELIAAGKKRWVEKNRDRYRLQRANRRAKKREVGGVLSPHLVKRLMTLQRGVCPCCNKPLNGEYHSDHIMPLALGGSNTDDNMQLLHPKCNLQKGAKHPIDFMQQRGLLL